VGSPPRRPRRAERPWAARRARHAVTAVDRDPDLWTTG
jgi:hypothetical protein